MKSCFAFCAAGLLLFCVSGNVLAQQPIECSGRPEVCGFFRHFITSLNDRDWIQFRACFSDDVTVFFDSPAAVRRRSRRADVEAMFQPLFPDPGAAPAENRVLFKPEDVLLQDLGDAAIVTFLLRQPDGVARRTLVLAKQKDGWKVVHIHASSFSIPK